MDLIQVFAQNWGALRYLAGFVLLPFLYLRDSAEVHKEYYEAAARLNGASEAEKAKWLSLLEDRLYIFTLEWWLVGALTVMLVGIFALGEIVSLSGWVHDGGGAVDPSAIEIAKGIVNTYGFGLAILTMLFVHWMKAQAFRALHQMGCALARGLD